MNKRHGFTILELVLYLGLLGIFLVIMTNLFVASLDTQLESQDQSALQQNGRYLIQRFTYDLHRAHTISSPNLGNQATSLDLVINDNGVDKHFIYTLNNQNLMLTVNEQQWQLNSQDIVLADLNFHRLGNSDINPQAKDGVQISFTLQSVVEKNSGGSVKNFQTFINLK